MVRNKFDMKSKGYGFVAFSDPEDFLKAWKEMNGKFLIGDLSSIQKSAADPLISPL